jgi:ABC-type transporter Mla maintaining outer membrane lipid asymmetry ATPase subunit MlaF
MPLVEIRSVIKNFGGLRPVRIRELVVEAGEVVTIDGADQQAGAVFTDLLTGTTLPDTGEVRIEGRSTASLADADDWLAFLDRFGLVNERIVLLDQLTLAQNLAIAHTLDIDPMSPEASDLAVRMAAEVGLDRAALDEPLSASSPMTRLRIRLGRALAHDPVILLVEHPSLGLERDDARVAAGLLRRIGRSRGLAVVVISGDALMSRRAATRALTWRPATGELVASAFWRRAFRL